MGSACRLLCCALGGLPSCDGVHTQGGSSLTEVCMGSVPHKGYWNSWFSVGVCVQGGLAGASLLVHRWGWDLRSYSLVLLSVCSLSALGLAYEDERAQLTIMRPSPL